METISNRTLLNALYAIDSEIENHELIFKNHAEHSEDERDAAGEYILELKSAFSELASIYRKREATDESLPKFSDIFEISA
ncbi:hypothetical protein V8J88_02205 [Massilia sp. W12]|uniref:hypothetical protein n=1 Tax=Massilia sp. W12 TaxID=3126507 RepID=UPI0030D0123F